MNPISLSSSGWVIYDVYILCLVYFLFAAYEQEHQSNQERMQKSLDEAKSAAIAKSMFISNVSHELRTPLHGILATAEILAKTRLNESQHALLNAIESCGTNLISVVNQVLTYARIEHGKMELEQNVFDLYTIMQEIGDGLEPIPERKNLDFCVCAEMNPLHRFLIGDVGVLRQIILNLLGNAIKFTDKGCIELITIEITEDKKDDKDLKPIKNKLSESNQVNDLQEGPKVKFIIGVNDTGRGIAPDFISQMYQPFSQEVSSLRRKSEGTGLGLSIVKGLLDMMHSRLEVDSELGQGSKFSFEVELPISDHLDNMYAAPLPFDHKHLKLPLSEQEKLTKRLRSLSYAVLDLEKPQRIVRFLDQWGFSYELMSKDELKNECIKPKQRADVVILNDNISDLEWYLNEFIQYYQKSKKTRKESVKEQQSLDKVVVDKDTEERPQRVLFFSTIGDYQNTVKILKRYKPQSTIVITKPAGPVKILTAIIKAMESLHKEPEVSLMREYDNILKAQEERERLIREEYMSYIKDSNKFGTMDISELAISPSRLTPPIINEGFLFGRDIETISEQKERVSTQTDKAKIQPVDEKKKEEIRKGPKDISFLIVEDNNVNEMILTTMLKQSGYGNCEVANNGLEAVKMFSQKPYDIVFMDLQMPICDGVEATKEIRKIERGEESHLTSPPTPRSTNPSLETHRIGRKRKKRRKKAIIVAMTGLASQEDNQIAEAAGCNEYLIKPVSIKTLNARMKSWIEEVLKVEEEENEDDKI